MATTEAKLPIDASDLEAAMSRAGRLLTLRQRTESEMTDRLGGAGFQAPVVAEAVARLKGLSLIDDAAFARAWIEERMRRKGTGPAVLRAELLAKGIDQTTVDQAVAEALPDEVAKATAVAAGLLGGVTRLPLPKQISRLSGALARRGFSEDAVQEALTAVLPPEGWD